MVRKRMAMRRQSSGDAMQGAMDIEGVRGKGRRRTLWIFAVSATLFALIAIAVGSLWYQAKVSTNNFIAHDVQTLEKIFRNIDESCGISSFKHEVNYVDFLTVGTFAGSEVGSMNLREPKNWHGPYVKDNPTIQTKLYQIIATPKGYFLAPGNGVRLSNGSVIGKDVVLNEQSDIPALIERGVLTNYDGRPMAVMIPGAVPKP